MLEAEWSFTHNVDELCGAIEDLLKDVLRSTISSPDAELLWRDGTADRRALLDAAAGDKQWARMTYTEAIEALRAHAAEHPGAFEFPPEWGKGLQSEHERWLAAAGPVFVTDYPATLKPFYMRANDDGRTVACFDLLVPGIGELVGGSLREERFERLKDAIQAHGLDASTYHWYSDLRRFGGAPHGGFGLGFERLISWVSGIDNVRECVAFPRWAGRMLL
jgi:asparaginyl-tRNA synthetase